MDEELRELSEIIRICIRATEGLGVDEDAFQGLLNIKDIKERTKLTRRNIYRHAYMLLLAKYGGEEWQIMQDWADVEEKLFISEDGERAKAALAILARKYMEQQPTTVVNVPSSLPAIEEKTPKKGLFR